MYKFIEIGWKVFKYAFLIGLWLCSVILSISLSAIEGQNCWV